MRCWLVLVLVAIGECFRSSKERKQAHVQPSPTDGALVRAERDGWLNPDNFAKCHLSESDCGIDDMAETTLVYTDDDQSLCYNGDKFAFLVRPGNRDQLLYFLPGGGVCFENPFLAPGKELEACYPTFILGLHATGFGGGVMNFKSPYNAFQNYTVVSPPYCSGGAHVANTTFGSGNETRYQFGYNNNEHARLWALRNVRPILKNFVLMGTSAGALGAGAWADFMLETFKYEKATVLLDSMMAVLPTGTQGPTVKNWEPCNLPFFRRFREECEAGEFSAQDALDSVIARYPNVAFAHVQSKADLVQRAFYTAVALQYLKISALITERSFYRETNAMMQRYNKHPNYVAYLIDGPHHTYTRWDYWFSASTAGATSWPPPAGTMGLFEWGGRLVNHEAVSSQCSGPLQPNGWKPFTGLSYCDEELFPKTLAVSG